MLLNKLKVFSGRANLPLAEKIAASLGDSLGRITLHNFPDGEISVRIEEDVRGRDIYLVFREGRLINFDPKEFE